MSQEAIMAKRNMILEYRIGSHLYGTNIETSDEDFSGVFIADEQYYLGLLHIEQCDLSIVSKKETGKNAPDAVDRVLYEFRKFVKLAMENNPNIIEQLFVDEDNLTYSNYIGESVLSKRHLFPWKGCKDKFLGYAFSQKHKMIIKKDNMGEIEAAYEYFSQCDADEVKRLLIQYEPMKLPFLHFFENQTCICGDMHLQPNITIKRVLGQLKERIDKFGNRKDLVSKHGYDTKFGMHLIRLMMEGIELLETGEIQFPLRGRDELLDIRNGKWSIKDIFTYSDDLEELVRQKWEKSSLPSSPRFDEINRFLIETVKRYHE